MPFSSACLVRSCSGRPAPNRLAGLTIGAITTKRCSERLCTPPAVVGSHRRSSRHGSRHEQLSPHSTGEEEHRPGISTFTGCSAFRHWRGVCVFAHTSRRARHAPNTLDVGALCFTCASQHNVM